MNSFFALPTWTEFESRITQQPQKYHRLSHEDHQAQHEHQEALVQYREQMQHQQQQRQRLQDFWPRPQPGSVQWSQPGGSRQYNQQQRYLDQLLGTVQRGGIQKPQVGGLRAHQLAHHQPSRAELAERAERARLAHEERLEREKHYKRKAELKKDLSAIYRHYTEYLEYFPLARRERPNDYLLDLLANQRMPAEPTSDMGLAIQYAKEHWENSWGMKDLEYVVGLAKKDIEKKNIEKK